MIVKNNQTKKIKYYSKIKGGKKGKILLIRLSGKRDYIEVKFRIDDKEYLCLLKRNRLEKKKIKNKEYNYSIFAVKIPESAQNVEVLEIRLL